MTSGVMVQTLSLLSVDARFSRPSERFALRRARRWPASCVPQRFSRSRRAMRLLCLYPQSISQSVEGRRFGAVGGRTHPAEHDPRARWRWRRGPPRRES